MATLIGERSRLAQNGAIGALPGRGQVIEVPISAIGRLSQTNPLLATDKRLIMSTFKVTTVPTPITATATATATATTATTKVAATANADKDKTIRNKITTKKSSSKQNSLESINSKCSISSGGNTNDDPPNQQDLNGSNVNNNNHNNNQVVEVRNRYVSPPVLAPNKDWPERGRCESASERGRNLAALMSAPAKKVPQAGDDDKGAFGLKDDVPGRRPSQVSVKVEVCSNPSGSNHEDGPPFLFAGILASLLGSLFYSISSLFIKLLPDDDSGGFEEKSKALFFRGLFMAILCSVSIVGSGSTFLVPRDEIWVNALRALFGTVGAFGAYCALKYISIGDCTAIIFSSPIWTSILSHFILKEDIQWIQVLALPISILGIVLIAHPGLIINPQYLSFLANNNNNINSSSLGQPEASVAFANSSHHEHHKHLVAAPVEEVNYNASFEERWPGIVIALTVSFVVSGTYIVLKYRKKTGVQTTTFWLAASITLSMFTYMCIFGFGQMPFEWTEWALLIGNGVASWLGQSAIQWAFLHEKASVLSIMRTMDVAFTFALSALFLDDDIYWTSILGSSVISLVVVSIVFSNWLQKLTCMSACNKKTVLEVSNSKQAASLALVSDKLTIETSPGKGRAGGAPYVISTSKI